MAELRMTRAALQEIKEAIEWYSLRSETATARFAGAVDEALDLIEANPTRFPFLKDNYRYLQVVGFPYILTFVEAQDIVWIMRFRHTSRGDRE
jgi:plasmid stabilization system protein ParE